MHLVERLKQLLIERPNARVLVLEATLEDVDATIGFCSLRGIRTGQTPEDQVLVFTPKYFQRKKRKLWPIDVVFVNNQHNVARTDRASSYKQAAQSINSQRIAPSWYTLEPRPILELGEMLVKGWTCGEPLILNCRMQAIAIPYSDLVHCGGTNPEHALFCQHCGRFRGVSYN